MTNFPSSTLVYGPSIKYVTLFLANFDPSVTLCHTSRDPQKYVTHLGTPIFSRPSTKIRTKAPCTNSLNCSRGILSGVLLGSLLSGSFCPEWFLSVPPSVRIHL